MKADTVSDTLYPITSITSLTSLASPHSTIEVPGHLISCLTMLFAATLLVSKISTLHITLQFRLELRNKLSLAATSHLSTEKWQAVFFHFKPKRKISAEVLVFAKSVVIYTFPNSNKAFYPNNSGNKSLQIQIRVEEAYKVEFF